MSPTDFGFLLLTSKLGNPSRVPLTMPQLRFLAKRISLIPQQDKDAVLTMSHLTALGLENKLSEKILQLLDDELQMNAYLSRAEKLGCHAVTRTNPDYPPILRKRLGNDAPGCLWLKGERTILNMPAVSLVGSRDLYESNRLFAEEVGKQAARQGFALVSGNARGADIAAQNACLEAGGYVISIIADALTLHSNRKHVLYVSEEDYDEPFSAQRALSRNRIIHALGEIVFIAQSGIEKGGTWAGTTKNLRHRWSPVYCYRDDSAASMELERLGATLISNNDLIDFFAFQETQFRFF